MLDELPGVAEVVLGTEGDDLNVVGVVLGELPDRGAFSATRRSMWCPEPEEHRPIAGNGLAQ